MAGFQSPNGNSTVYTAHSINTFHFVNALIQIRILNAESSEIKHDLLKILMSGEFEDEKITEQIPTKDIDELKEHLNKKSNECRI